MGGGRIRMGHTYIQCPERDVLGLPNEIINVEKTVASGVKTFTVVNHGVRACMYAL